MNEYTWRVKTTITAYPNGCVYVQGAFQDGLGSVPLGAHASLDSNLGTAMNQARDMVLAHIEYARGEQPALDLDSLEG